MKHNIQIGDKVRFQHIKQKMEVTFIDKRWFSHDRISTIYQLPDETMSILSGINPKSLTIIESTL